MTDGQTEVGAQDVNTLPKPPCDGTTGHAEADLKRQARQAGEIVRDPLHPCRGCHVYRDDCLGTPICELCRTNPEVAISATRAIERLAK